MDLSPLAKSLLSAFAFIRCLSAPSVCDFLCCRARLSCAQCLEHTWLKQDTKNMEAKQLSKERMKKYILRRRWQVREPGPEEATILLLH